MYRSINRTLTCDEKRALVKDQDNLTIDGKPAIVVGYHNQFATVVALDESARVEFAWSTVERIVNKDGAFKS
jgi:hypothetical protein